MQTSTNLPARIRMATLYAIAQTLNGRVANTCNFSEDWVGYATRYGDGAGDFSPLSLLTTDEVIAIGEYLGLPKELTRKVPIDGLCGLTDEDNLGFSYAILNRYIRRGGADREVTCDGMGFKLFMQFVRALNESHCKYFLYENNSSISKDIQNEISKRLQVKPVEINSMEFSAQMRKRLYWTNIPFSKEYPHSDKVIKDIEYSCKHDIKSFEKYKDTIRFNRDNTIVSWDTSGKGNYSQQNRARYNTIKMNTLPSSGNDKNNIYLGEYSFRKIHPIEAERLQTLPDGFTECVKSASKRVELCGNGWTVDVIAWILKNLKFM